MKDVDHTCFFLHTLDARRRLPAGQIAGSAVLLILLGLAGCSPPADEGKKAAKAVPPPAEATTARAPPSRARRLTLRDVTAVEEFMTSTLRQRPVPCLCLRNGVLVSINPCQRHKRSQDQRGRAHRDPTASDG